MIEMTLEMAERAAKAAHAKAKALGTVMTVAVVDEAGRPVLVARGDGAGFFSTDTAHAKAVAAVAFRRATKELGEMALKGSAFWAAVPTVLRGEALPSIGAVPLMKGGRVIGAIGCGGGTGEQDHECAVAGADTVGSA
jgi:glc operon protein GlcG